MPLQTTSEKLKYALDETSFHESKFANIIVENASGPIHPSASFTLFGSILLSPDNQHVTVDVTAKGVQFSPEAGLERVDWMVTAELKKKTMRASVKNM